MGILDDFLGRVGEIFSPSSTSGTPNLKTTIGSDMGSTAANLQSEITSKNSAIIDEYGKTGKMTPEQVREEKRALYSPENQQELMGKNVDELTKMKKSLDEELKTLSAEGQTKGSGDVARSKEVISGQGLSDDKLAGAVAMVKENNESLRGQGGSGVSVAQQVDGVSMQTVGTKPQADKSAGATL